MIGKEKNPSADSMIIYTENLQEKNYWHIPDNLVSFLGTR